MGLAQDVKAALGELGVRPTKHRGQNFMVDEAALDAVAGAVGAAHRDVIEVGPGLGFLTRRLLARGFRVTALEKDRNFARHLSKAIAAPALNVVEADALEYDVRSSSIAPPVAVAGNIPYNITTPLIEWILAAAPAVDEAVLTVQKEVADRLAAKPGTKAWGALSVFVQYHSRVEWVRGVGRAAFFPPPKVDSAVVRLSFGVPPAAEDTALFFDLVRSAFQKRRKTLLNALEGGPRALRKQAVSEALAAAGIDARRRPETLSIVEWAALSARIAKPSGR